jgi:hypothetical protein
MKELYVFCEGPTEQNFCKQVLQAHLFPRHDGEVRPIRIAHSRRHGVVHRGGVSRYSVMKNDIRNALNEHKRASVYFTSMIDLYGIPSDFPGKADHQRNPDNPRSFVEALEVAFGQDIGDARFIPHLQLHEYETLLFADVESFQCFFDKCEREIKQLQAIADSFASVEHINDGPQTAPSKRIIDIFPGYKGLKTTAGPDIAYRTGIKTLGERCPHFSDWLTTLGDVLAEGE